MATPTRDYYGTLGVRRDATAEELKRAYRRLARELHPDVNPEPAAQARFAEISTAYEVLRDPQKRQVVDLGGDPLAPGGGQGDAGFGMGFSDIMDAFFGGASGARRGRGPSSRRRQGGDALLRLDLDLTETAFGVQRDLAVETAVACGTCRGAGTAPGTRPTTCDVCGGRGEISTVQQTLLGQVMQARVCPNCSGHGTVISSPCPSCAGDGRVRARRTIAVDVPAGVEDGMRIRLVGQGEVGPGGGPAGDLYVEVHERRHELFTREGDDLHCRVTLPMTAAALGTTLLLPTLDGEEEVEISPGTQPGSVVSLRARGVPHLRATGRGDLLVRVEVATPTRLDAEQEQLLRRLAVVRDEERPDAVRPTGGLFTRVRGAFK